MSRWLVTMFTLALVGCGTEAPEAPAPVEKAEAEAPADGSLPAPADVAAPPADATTTASGLAYKVLKSGPDATRKPVGMASVTVHYTGWTTDGKMFDSSRKRGQPATFRLNQVIAGWTEGLQLMAVGDTARLWIPQDLAYQGRPGKPAGMLVFDVELLDFTDPPAAPPDVAGIPADATTTASGLAYRILEKGAGTEHPTAESKVTVHYTGWTTDGQMFDSSVVSGRPASFPLNGVIPGWTEGLQLLTEGDKARFWIPEGLAYAGQPGQPAGMLVFDVQLLSFQKPIAAPPDVAAPPADAKKTASGLAYKVIKPGTGDAHPTAESKVTVHYSGWTTDGKMFDSSVMRNRPATFPLGGVIAGWTEGLQLMKQGETTRFWIPENLAYGGQPGKPAGMLVFDVELIEWK